MSVPQTLADGSVNPEWVALKNESESISLSANTPVMDEELKTAAAEEVAADVAENVEASPVVPEETVNE